MNRPSPSRKSVQQGSSAERGSALLDVCLALAIALWVVFPLLVEWQKLVVRWRRSAGRHEARVELDWLVAAVNRGDVVVTEPSREAHAEFLPSMRISVQQEEGLCSIHFESDAHDSARALAVATRSIWTAAK